MCVCAAYESVFVIAYLWVCVRESGSVCFHAITHLPTEPADCFPYIPIHRAFIGYVPRFRIG